MAARLSDEEPSLRGQMSAAVAVAIGRLAADAKFCGFRIQGGQKRPYSKLGAGVAADTRPADLWRVHELKGACPGDFWGLAMHAPIVQRDLTLACLDLDYKRATGAPDPSITKLEKLARDAGHLVETSHSGKGCHIWLFAKDDPTLPAKVRLSEGQEIEVFGMSGSHRTAVMLTGSEMSGAVKAVGSLRALLEGAGIDAGQRGGNEPSEPAQSIVGAAKLTAGDVRTLLAYVVNADLEYDDWLRTCMAAKSAGGAYEDIVSWSRASKKHDQSTFDAKWQSWKDRPDGVGVGTLYRLAQGGGWDGILSAPQKPAPEISSAAYLSVDAELPEPSDLFAAAMPGPFPVRESMPAVLADWVEMQVAATGLDAAGFAIAPLAVLSGASDRSVRVRLGPTHLSSCVIWAAILGETGTGKSPAMDLAVDPLKRIDADLGRDFASAIRAHEGNPKSEPKPVRQMHVLSDATIEALGRKLHESDGHRVLRHVDEGSGWLNAMGRYAAAGKSDGERGAYLTGWVGPHDHTIARIERGDLLVPEMGIAMLFGITPGKVREGYAEASEEGLLARCLAVLLDRGKHTAPDRTVSPGRAEAAYAAVVRRVARAKGEIVLSDESQRLFDGFRSECRELCDALAAVSPGLSAVLAKLPENTGRIAALYSLCADRVDGSVHIEQMTQAIAMARALLAHAKVLYRTVLAVDSATALQRDLAERILRQNATRIARRDLRTAKWESADEPTRRAAIDMLGADRWLLAEDSQRMRAGSRFSEATAWHVNPLALDGRFDAVRTESVQRAERALAALARL